MIGNGTILALDRIYHAPNILLKSKPAGYTIVVVCCMIVSL